MKTILDIIGAPAALEQCAEECSELAQACLKLGRKLRGENPTPKDESALYASLEEEIADVENSVAIIKTHLIRLDNDRWDCLMRISEISNDKIVRWKERLGEKVK